MAHYDPDLTVPRDRHLFGDGPKRLLALDGGGVRGAISLGFLEEMERLLRAAQGEQKRLGDWFDLIGGTSTGAIIAGGLALGFDTQQIGDFYRNRAKLIFRPSMRRIPGLRSRFDALALSAEIQRVVGDRTLDSTDLITGFALVTKRVDTGSPWIIANNPRAPYWDTREGHTYVGNRKYLLSNLVRASTAAPFYFDPEVITIHDGQPNGLFIDGGVSPHNNPSYILFMTAILKAYGICWPTGTDNLTIVSIGTGGYRRIMQEAQLGFMKPIKLAYHALSSLMDDAQIEVLKTMQWLGKSLTPWPINREIGALIDDTLPCGPLFNFVRYDVNLQVDWLKSTLDLDVSERQILELREMDKAGVIPLLYEIGRRAAKLQVKPEHFGLRPG